VSASETTNLLGTITNQGTILLNGGNGANGILNLTGNVMLNGGGTLTMTSVPSGGGSSFLQGNGQTLTNVDNTIQGAGTIGNGSLVLINQAGGTVLANDNVNGQSLVVNGSSTTNNGTFQANAGSLLRVMSAFTNFSGSTLTGGTYIVNGTTPNAGTMQIDAFGNTGGEVVTNAASITLNGPNSNITNAAGLDALSNLATNAAAGSFTIQNGRNFTTPGSFTNNGALTVGAGSTFSTPNLTNFDAGAGTLTGGSYTVAGTLQFTNANVVTNAATIVLDGPTSQIIDQNNLDGLRNFATNAAAGSFTIQNGRNFTTPGSFTNNGALTVGAGSTFSTPNLTNFDAGAGTLTGGSYTVAGTLQFTNANIVTNAATIVLEGGGSQIIDQTSADAFRNFATNAARGNFTIQNGRNLITPGSFTNLGTLTIGAGSTFATSSGTSGSGPSNGSTTASGTLSVANGSNFIAGNLTNFDSPSSTLSGGTYLVGGTLQFNNANIVSNAGTIALDGAASQIIDQNSLDALRGFATNTAAGSFTLSGGRIFTTAGDLSSAGSVSVGSGSTLNVGTSGANNYSQSGGLTTVAGALNATNYTQSAGTMNVTGALTAPTVSINGGTLFGTGTIVSANPTIASGGTLLPGTNSTTPGTLNFTGPLTINGTLAEVLIASGFGVTNVSGQFALGSGSSVLNIIQSPLYNPPVGTTLTIMTFGSLALGSVFGTIQNAIFNNGTEMWNVLYNSDNIQLIAASVGSATNRGTAGANNYSQSRDSTAVTGTLNASNYSVGDGSTTVQSGGGLLSDSDNIQLIAASVGNATNKGTAGANNYSQSRDSTAVTGTLNATNYSVGEGSTTVQSGGGLLSASGAFQSNGGLNNVLVGGSLPVTGGYSQTSGTTTVTPEPGSLLLFGTGLGALVWRLRKRGIRRA
jgi:hypothetical protein